MPKEFSWCYCCGVVTCYITMAVHACRYALAHLNLAPSPCSLPNQEAGGRRQEAFEPSMGMATVRNWACAWCRNNALSSLQASLPDLPGIWDVMEMVVSQPECCEHGHV